MNGASSFFASRRGLVLVAKLAVAAALIAWLVASGRFDVGVYRGLASGPHLGLVAATGLVQALAFGLFIMRWWGLARAQGLPISGGAVMRTGLRGLFTQLFVPGGLGTDGLRLLYVRSRYRERLVHGIASLLADRLSGLIGLVLLGTAACVLHWRLGGDTRLLPLLYFFSTLLAAGVLGLLLLGVIGALPLFARASRLRWLAEAIDAGRAYARHKWALAAAIGLSMFGHAVTAGAACLALAALGDSPPPLDVLAITSALNLVRMIPITPMGLGVADGAAEMLFALIGLSSGAELQMLLRVLSVLLFLGAGLSFFTGEGGRRDA